MEKMKLNIQLFGTWGADATFDKKLYGQVGYSNVTRNGNTITVTWGSRVKSNYGTFNYGMGGCSYWKLGSSTGGNTTKYYGKGQVNVALMVLDSLGLDIPVCGMVKDDNHRTRGLYYNNVEVIIKVTYLKKAGGR